MPDPRTIADRYELVDRLGAGGGGVVWRARDLSLNRTVAVKEIDLDSGPHTEEREVVRTRALREARAAARLEHPNVVSVYDVRDDDGAIHIIMEFVDAPSLKYLVDHGGPLPPTTVASIGVDVLGALEAAHAAGIIHRDIKPSNVLVGDDGASVTDFGIAAVTGDTALTLSGQTLGTPDYVSPEQVTGDEVGPHTDMWALGATLFFAVEGRAPFHQERAISTVHSVVNDPPAPMARAGSLGPVLRDLLAKAPADRLTVAQARARLHAVAQGDGAADATTGMAHLQDRTRELPSEAPSPPPAAAAMSRGESEAETQDPMPPRTVVHDVRQKRGSRRAPVLIGIVGLLLVVGLVVASALSGVDRSGVPSEADDAPAATDAPADATEQPEPTATDPPATEADPTAPETESASPSPATAAEVPEGWEIFEGPSYTIGHPEGWSTRDGGAPNNIDLVAPDDEDGYLRVANTDAPAEDVLQDTERIETAFERDHEGYERIRLEPTEYRDSEAAIWEYTFEADGITFHAIHLNLSTGEHGYALNHVVPEDGWDEAAGRFEQFKAAFAPQ